MASSESRESNVYYQARVKARLSVNEVAAATGYDRSTVYKIERGEIDPKRDYIFAFSDFANVPVSELPAATSEIPFKYNEYAEKVIGIIRSAIPLPQIGGADIRKTGEKQPLEFSDQKTLHAGILQLFIDESLQADGSIQFLWTGRNYEEFSPFYGSLYNDWIPSFVAAGAKIHHLLRDGVSPSEKLGIVAFVLPKVLRIRNHERFSIRIVRDMHIQSFVNDLYSTAHSGSILCLTSASAGEPSLGLWTNRRHDMFGKYLRFVEHNADERVLFLPQTRRKEFFQEYLTTESRTGDWVMLQKLPANATRPISDYEDNTRWAKRMKAIEEARNGPPIEEVIRLRRIAARLFRDRLSNSRFQQIMSRQAIQYWIQTGRNPDLNGKTDKLDDDVIDHADEIKSRLKSLISLMDDSNGNFQIALADEAKFESLGWNNNSLQSVAWVVQGLQGTVFEGHEESNDKTVSEYNLIIKDAEFSKTFAKAFAAAWRSLPGRDTDQRSVREFLVSKLREVG